MTSNIDASLEETLSYIAGQLKTLTSIASPTGYTRAATDYLMETLRDMGFGPERSNKGNVLVELGGEGEPLVLASHVDTLGAMVRSIKDNGRLRPTTLGGHSGLRPMARTAPSTRATAMCTRVWSSIPSLRRTWPTSRSRLSRRTWRSCSTRTSTARTMCSSWVFRLATSSLWTLARR